VRSARDHGTIAADGSRLYGPWGGLFAIPPELRRFIATQHQHLSACAQHRSIAMLPGKLARTHELSIDLRVLAELDAPPRFGMTRPAAPSAEAPTLTAACFCTA